MGIKVLWDNADKTIARYDFSDPWTWPEFHEAVTEIHQMVRSVSHKVDFIADMTESNIAPGNALFHIRRAIQHAPRNSGLLVVVGGSAFVTAIVGVVSRFTRNVQRAPSLDDARQVIVARQEYRRTASRS